MSCLHTVNKSPDHGLLQKCLATAAPGDAILLIEDGTYHCLLTADALPRQEIKFYGLQEDMLARGILDRNSAGIEPVDYPGFVALCCEHDKTLAWF